jgi:hypothetical protein
MRIKVAESLAFCGRQVEAAATLRISLAADPASVDANYLLGCVQIMLGDQAGSLASLSRAPDIAADPNMSVDLAVAQFYNGLLTREQIEHRAETEFNPPNFATLLFALVDHPDARQRDPEWVLKILAEREPLLGTARWPKAIRLVAHIRREDWNSAVGVLEDSFQRPVLPLMTPVCYEFTAALVYARLERPTEARQSFQRGAVEWTELVRDQAEAWERSDAMRWRRAAEAALER